MDDHTETCPNCKTDLRYEVGGKTYSHKIGVEIPGAYDGVLYWMCPTCGWAWHRWDHYLKRVANPFVTKLQDVAMRRCFYCEDLYDIADMAVPDGDTARCADCNELLEPAPW